MQQGENKKAIEEDLKDRDSLKFHYNREERLKKLKRDVGTHKGKFFSKKRNRSFVVIIVDIFILCIVAYLLNKPANVYLEKEENSVLYQLNVTGIRGNKVLVAFTIKNQGNDTIAFSESEPVIIKIKDKKDYTATYEKPIEKNTIIKKGEISSIIFLLNEEDLPRVAGLKLYYKSSSFPIFSKIIRF